MSCVDQSVSITEEQMKKLVLDIRFIEEALGKEKKTWYLMKKMQLNIEETIFFRIIK